MCVRTEIILFSYFCLIVDKEEVNKCLKVLSVDFNISLNTKEHHTDKFACTEERERNGKKMQPELVIRRGQPFTLDITFDQEYDKKQHDLEFTFTTGTSNTIYIFIH